MGLPSWKKAREKIAIDGHNKPVIATMKEPMHVESFAFLRCRCTRTEDGRTNGAIELGPLTAVLSTTVVVGGRPRAGKADAIRLAASGRRRWIGIRKWKQFRILSTCP